MKKSTITVITVLTLIALHGAHLLFGLKGVAGALLVTVIFFAVARAFYWRQLRKLHSTTRDLPPEVRELVRSMGGLDAEAQRDLKKLDRKP